MPLFGGGGDAGIMQICFQRTPQDLWSWRANIERGRTILQTSINFANTVPGRVRTEVVRGMGPFPNATNFTTDQLRRESIHAYNAGTKINSDGYWQWNNAAMVWTEAPQGGQAGYVDLVLGRSPSCP